MTIQKMLIRGFISGLLFLLFAAHSYGLIYIRLFDQLEKFSYDARLLLTMPKTIDKRVVIVDIDEKSLAAEGQWPWPRDKLAALVVNAFDRYQVQVMGFDMVFPEPDNRALSLMDRLAAGPFIDNPDFQGKLPAIKQALDFDGQFAESLKGRNTVLGYVFRQNNSANTGVLGVPILTKNNIENWNIDYIKTEAFTGNQARLNASANSSGFFDNPNLEEDGVFRRVPVLQQFEGNLYPSLALETLRVAMNKPKLKVQFDPPEATNGLNLEKVITGAAHIPIDENFSVYVPYRGSSPSFPYVSATDIIRGTADPALLRGTIVLLGTTAPGLKDLRSTPVGRADPGVEVHANIISGILDGRIKQKAPYYSGIEIVELFLIGTLLAVLFPILSPLMGALLTFGLILTVTLLSFSLWQYNHFIVPLGKPILFIIFVFLAQLLYSYFVESKKTREVTKLFGQYVPPEVVEQLAENPQPISMEGESREMTVLFSDIRGFTTISEKMDAKELSQMMNQFLTLLTQVIHQNKGTIDKYMGDAIMAFWGAPLNDPEHARHTLEAGMAMAKAVRQLDAQFAAKGWEKLYIGVGISTGTMRVGNMGSEFRVAYTVMGDSVNLGSRLEGQTKDYGVQCICSQSTREKVPDWIFRELDLVRVKGKHEPVAIFEPIGHKDSVGAELRQELLRYRQALKLYRGQQWEAAESEFFVLSRSHLGVKIYELYLERIAFFKKNPPPAQWDGVVTLTKK
jgi:adenylate cyclase